MKVLKYISVIFFSLSLMLISSGCGNYNNYVDQSSYTDMDGNSNVNEFENNVVTIYNVHNEEIGSITCYGYSALANNNILYTRLLGDTSSSKKLEYCLYDIDTKECYALSVIDDWMYEASYDILTTDDHLYLSVSTGEYSDFEGGRQTIYDIDLLDHSMSPLIEIEGGVPYNSYTVANGKLVVAELLYNGDTDLVEVDLDEKNSLPIVHKHDETDCFIHDSIRHIYADNKNIYTVRLDWDKSETNYFLYLDKYDFNYNLVDSIDLREFCVSTDIERTNDSKINEWKQFVAYFFVHNDLVYYQNFSTTNAIGVFEGDEINRLFETSRRFSYVNSSSESNEHDLFIQSFGDNTQDRNIFYRIDSKTHSVETAEFFADNHDYTFSAAFRDKDKILLSMGYVPFDKGERLPERLYYIDINDLEFTPMD